MMFLRPHEIGHTYAIASTPYDGWAKIGRTGAGCNPRMRLRSLQTGNPRTLEIRAFWDIDAEAMLHDVYADFRGSGEWFALPAPLLDHMADCATHKRPTILLLMEWPVDRIWELAGGRDDRSAEQLARLFQVDFEKDRPRSAHAEAA